MLHRLLSFKRLSMLFLAIFAVLVGGAMVFQNYWLEPGERCERDGKWYDIETRICAQPISIAEITGRPIGVSRAEASAQANRELVDIERQLTAERHARDAAVAAERARLAQR
jgi:hypothetical protein